MNADRLEKADLSASGPDILPPHSDEAEKGVLGCVLLAPEESMDAITKVGVQPDWFYDLRHRTLYENLARLFEERSAIDAVTVVTRLRDNNQIGDIGGLVYYSQIPDSTPSAANLPHYLDILRTKLSARQLIKLAAKLTADVYECADMKALTETAYQSFDSIARAHVLKEKARAKPITEILNAAADRYERIYAGQQPGIQTGFAPIDQLGGLIPGEMVLIAGETKIGKSTLALNFLHGALKSGTKAAVFSLEMSDQAWIDRLLSLELEIDRRAFRTASFMTNSILQKLADNFGRIGQFPLWICDDASIKTSEMERVLTKLALSEGIGMFVVDYAQLVMPADGQDSREQQVAKIGRDIRRICQQRGLVALVLSQLNDDGKIRESRALLHECHLGFVMEERDGSLWVRQAAGRDVAVPDFPVDFDGHICRIRQKQQTNNNHHHNAASNPHND